ncbi:MAG: metallophosphoesterase, partial [Candidatus Riesia sp.]|nr:metallophosphoesterase [Candidatus Riesia sp.]
MRLGILSDLHLRGKDLQSQVDALDLALTDMLDNNVDWVLCAGDVWDSSTVGDSEASAGKVVSSFLAPVEKANLPWVIVGGNHDRRCQGKTTSSLEVLASHPLIKTVSSKPEHISVSDGNDQVIVAAYPWMVLADTPYGKTFKGWIKEELSKTKEVFDKASEHYKIFLSHCALEGSYTPY